MSAGARVAAFVALLAAIFAGAALAGGALDPDAGDDDAHRTPAGDHAGDHAGAMPAGVASSHDGLRIVAERTRFAAGSPATLRLRILDEANDTLREFDTEQARRMHLILVRRDLRRYQHLHPAQGADGGWSVRLTLPEAGVYRAFADFRTSGERHTLGIDLFVPGSFEPRDLPPAARSARVDGYDVALTDHHSGELRFAVRRDGRDVTDLQPYLGARGHLVELRAGDLAYRHVHPVDAPAGVIAFDTGRSEPGTYRLFVQFRHRDRVHTAAFTRGGGP